MVGKSRFPLRPKSRRPAPNIPGTARSNVLPFDGHGQHLHFIIIENLHTTANGSTHQNPMCLGFHPHSKCMRNQRLLEAKSLTEVRT